MGTHMSSDSIWKTWKPYVFIAALVAIGAWWWNAQSPAAQLKDGVYDCVAVFVNESKKYEVYVDESGTHLAGDARVQGGEVRSYSAPNALGWRNGTDITIRKSGTSHFTRPRIPLCTATMRSRATGPRNDPAEKLAPLRHRHPDLRFLIDVELGQLDV